MAHVTVLQPDPDVSAGRVGERLAAMGVGTETVRLWADPVGDPPATGGVLVLGGPMDAHADLPWVAPVKDLLRRCVAADVPVLGICLGHQLLADALGGEVVVGHQAGPERGPVTVSWLPAAADDPLVGEAAALGDLVQPAMHADGVVRLPPGATLLATGEAYEVQAFRVGSAVGVQFHPEATPQIMAGWYAEHGDPDEMVHRMTAVDADVRRGGQALTDGFVRVVAAR